MDFKKLKEFIDIAKESGVTELEYEEKDTKFAVSFSTGKAAVSTPMLSSVTPVGYVEGLDDAGGTRANTGLIEITSPFVGTFYRSASPDADPYIKLGDRVSSGSVLCIVEAMKIMNEIESDVSGEIVEICVENENYVEFGQTLFRIKP